MTTIALLSSAKLLKDQPLHRTYFMNKQLFEKILTESVNSGLKLISIKTINIFHSCWTQTNFYFSSLFHITGVVTIMPHPGLLVGDQDWTGELKMASEETFIHSPMQKANSNWNAILTPLVKKSKHMSTSHRGAQKLTTISFADRLSGKYSGHQNPS